MARFIPEEWAIHFPANNEFHLNSILRDVFQPSMQADAGRWYVAIRLGAIIQLGVSLPTKNKQLKALSAVDPYVIKLLENISDGKRIINSVKEEKIFSQ